MYLVFWAVDFCPTEMVGFNNARMYWAARGNRLAVGGIPEIIPRPGNGRHILSVFVTFGYERRSQPEVLCRSAAGKIILYLKISHLVGL